MNTYCGSGGIAPHAFLTSELNGSERSAFHPGQFILGATGQGPPDAHWIGGCLGLRSG